MSDLAVRQAELVAALVAGGPVPAGFDAARLSATHRALLRKRADLAAVEWPLLAASLGPAWHSTFVVHHDGRPPVGALRDGWDLARALAVDGGLDGAASAELAARESALRYDGTGPPTPRRRTRLRAAWRRVRR